MSILSKFQNLLVHSCYYLNTYRIGNDAISLSLDTGFCVLFSDQLATDLFILFIFSRNQLLVLLVFSIFVYLVNFHSDHYYLFSVCLRFYFLFSSPTCLRLKTRSLIQRLSSFLNIRYKFPLSTTLVALKEFSYIVSLLSLFHNIF